MRTELVCTAGVYVLYVTGKTHRVETFSLRIGWQF